MKIHEIAETVDVTQKELPAQNDITNVSNTSESGLLIDDAQDIESDIKTPMTSLADSKGVTEPSVIEMQGTSILMS